MDEDQVFGQSVSALYDATCLDEQYVSHNGDMDMNSG